MLDDRVVPLTHVAQQLRCSPEVARRKVLAAGPEASELRGRLRLVSADWLRQTLAERADVAERSGQ